jgi:hypothetical protein
VSSASAVERSFHNEVPVVSPQAKPGTPRRGPPLLQCGALLRVKLTPSVQQIARVTPLKKIAYQPANLLRW